MTKKLFTKTIPEICIKFIIKYKFLIIGFIILLGIAGFFGIRRIKVDSSNESMFRKNNEVLIMNNKFKEIFGNENFVFILIESDELFTKETLSFIRKLDDDLNKNLPFLKKTTSLTNIEYINAIDSDLYVENIIDENIPADKNELKKIKEKVLNKENYINRIITEDGTKTGILIEFIKIPEAFYINKNKKNVYNDDILFEKPVDINKYREEKDSYKLISNALDNILLKYKNPKIKITASGRPVMEYKINELIPKQTALAFLVTLLISVIMLIILFRDIRAVLGPVAVMIFSNIITYGLMGWIGIPLSLVMIILATLLLVLSISYSIHVINHFKTSFNKTGNRAEAVKYAFKNAAWPCFITAATTAVGFISFIAVPIIPVRNLGIICGISVFLTYLLVMTIIPIFLSFGKNKEIKESSNKNSKMQKIMTKWAEFSVKNWKLIGVFTIVIVGFFLFFAFKIRVDTDTIRIVGERSKFIKDAKYITDKLGAIYSYEVLIELPENDMVKNPEVLKSLDSMINLIKNQETTKLTTSVNNLIKDINMTLNNNDKSFFKVPDSKNLIAQYMLLYEMSGGEELYDYIDYDGKILRVSVQANKYSTGLRKTFKEIKEYGKHIFPENTKINITGDTALSINSIGLLVDGQILSIIFAVCGISLMMIIILKSVPAGLLSMIPNILPLVIMTGLMGLLKIPIDAHTVITAPLLIGIAVDDTVHYFLHFRQERLNGNDYKISNIITFNKIGWALVYTSIILALGFASFLFTSVDAVNNYGLIFIVGIISALLSDLLISPVLCVVLKLFRKVK